MSEQNPPPDPGVSEQKKRPGTVGRPEYKPTDEQRAQVRELVAAKATKGRIALALGISPVTLRKYFAAELAAPGDASPESGMLDFGGSSHQPPPIEAAPPKEQAGRPEFEPNYRQREDVRLMKADDWSDDRIARRLGISRNTLLKHFGDELEDGVDQVRAAVLRNLMRESNNGSVSASDRLLKLPGMIAPAQRLETPAAADDEPMGKKARALHDAKTAENGTSWASLVPTQH